jgi:hypothetical protein
LVLHLVLEVPNNVSPVAVAVAEGVCVCVCVCVCVMITVVSASNFVCLEYVG